MEKSHNIGTCFKTKQTSCDLFLINLQPKHLLKKTLKFGTVIEKPILSREFFQQYRYAHELYF